jgi:hypothetical protein
MSFGTSRVYRCGNTDGVYGLLFSETVQERGKEEFEGQDDMASYTNTCKSSISAEIER